MALNPSNSSNLEQLALKGLNYFLKLSDLTTLVPAVCTVPRVEVDFVAVSSKLVPRVAACHDTTIRNTNNSSRGTA